MYRTSKYFFARSSIPNDQNAHIGWPRSLTLSITVEYLNRTLVHVTDIAIFIDKISALPIHISVVFRSCCVLRNSFSIRN